MASSDGYPWSAPLREATYLREQAARCRLLASRITADDVVRSLLGLAEEYEEEAMRRDALDREILPRPSPGGSGEAR